MGENSSIQWTTHTFNPWVGCQRVSPGCEHCYAEAYDKRVGGVPKKQRADPKVPETRWGPKGRRVRTSVANWAKPLAWNKAAEAAGERHLVFCSSLADVFEDRRELAPWRLELFDLIRRTPSLDWQLLTKRPQNISRLIEGAIGAMFASKEWATGGAVVDELLHPWMNGHPPANVWLGTTVEDQERADVRIPALLKVPAVVRFLSCEPLLERVEINHERLSLLDWLIVGGESGPGARPFHLDWARDLVRQCRKSGPAPFVKQLGAKPLGFCRTGPANGYDDRDFCDLYEAGESTFVCGAECRLRLVDPAGADPAEWPTDLRVREFPTR
jgi:protein gp37